MSFLADIKGDVRNSIVSMIVTGTVLFLASIGSAVWKAMQAQPVPWAFLISIAIVGIGLLVVAIAMISRSNKVPPGKGIRLSPSHSMFIAIIIGAVIGGAVAAAIWKLGAVSAPVVSPHESSAPSVVPTTPTIAQTTAPDESEKLADSIAEPAGPKRAPVGTDRLFTKPTPFPPDAKTCRFAVFRYEHPTDYDIELLRWNRSGSFTPDLNLPCAVLRRPRSDQMEYCALTRRFTEEYGFAAITTASFRPGGTRIGTIRQSRS